MTPQEWYEGAKKALERDGQRSHDLQPRHHLFDGLTLEELIEASRLLGERLEAGE